MRASQRPTRSMQLGRGQAALEVPPFVDRSAPPLRFDHILVGATAGAHYSSSNQ